MVAAVASGAHGAGRAWDAWLLLKLLHFRRQCACPRMTRGNMEQAAVHHIKLTDLIFEVANVAHARVVFRLRVEGRR